MSLGYSTIAIGIAGHQGKQPGVVYNMDGFTTAQGVFGCESHLVANTKATQRQKPTNCQPERQDCNYRSLRLELVATCCVSAELMDV